MRKFEEIFEQNSSENIILIKRLLEESRKHAIQNVNSQLTRFKEIDQIGKLPIQYLTPFFFLMKMCDLKIELKHLG